MGTFVRKREKEGKPSNVSSLSWKAQISSKFKILIMLRKIMLTNFEPQLLS